MIRTATIALVVSAAIGSVAHAQLLHDVIDHEVTLQDRTDRVAKTSTLWSGPVTVSYSGVAFQGFSDDPEVTGEVRYETLSGWSDWESLYMVRSSTDGAFMAAHRNAFERASEAFEVTFSSRVDLISSGVFTERAERADLGEEGPAFRPDVRGEVLPPRVRTRAEWGAEPFRGTPDALARPTIRNMTFHHAAGFSASNLQEGIRQVKAIQDFHQNGRGWSDIGYHFVVDKAGNLFQGRPYLDSGAKLTDGPRLALGAHAGGANTGNIGVCLLGCYHPPEGGNCQDTISPAAMDTMVTLFSYLAQAYDVEPSALGGHRDFSSTSCPGDNNYRLLGNVRDEIENLLEIGNTTPIDVTQGFIDAYPNPFQGQTTIRYVIPSEAVVRVEVYDALGKRVRSLVDAFQQPRVYRTQLDQLGLSSGVYLVRMQVEGFSGSVEFEDTIPVTVVN